KLVLGAPFALRVPHPCVRCKGAGRCCMCYLILLWTRDQTHLAPTFPTPALRQEREGTRLQIRAFGGFSRAPLSALSARMTFSISRSNVPRSVSHPVKSAAKRRRISAR